MLSDGSDSILHMFIIYVASSTVNFEQEYITLLVKVFSELDFKKVLAALLESILLSFKPHCQCRWQLHYGADK